MCVKRMFKVEYVAGPSGQGPTCTDIDDGEFFIVGEVETNLLGIELTVEEVLEREQIRAQRRGCGPANPAANIAGAAGVLGVVGVVAAPGQVPVEQTPVSCCAGKMDEGMDLGLPDIPMVDFGTLPFSLDTSGFFEPPDQAFNFDVDFEVDFDEFLTGMTDQ